MVTFELGLSFYGEINLCDNLEFLDKVELSSILGGNIVIVYVLLYLGLMNTFFELLSMLPIFSGI